MSALFVTSTGTDIGKTFVTAGLIRYLREAGPAVHALKPVVSGFDPSVADDQRSGRSARGARPAGRRADEIAAIAPWRFARRCRPIWRRGAKDRTIDYRRPGRFQPQGDRPQPASRS